MVPAPAPRRANAARAPLSTLAYSSPTSTRFVSKVASSLAMLRHRDAQSSSTTTDGDAASSVACTASADDVAPWSTPWMITVVLPRSRRTASAGRAGLVGTGMAQRAFALAGGGARVAVRSGARKAAPSCV